MFNSAVLVSFQLKLNELDSVAHKLDITVGTHGAQTMPEVRRDLHSHRHIPLKTAVLIIGCSLECFRL